MQMQVNLITILFKVSILFLRVGIIALSTSLGHMIVLMSTAMMQMHVIHVHERPKAHSGKQRSRG